MFRDKGERPIGTSITRLRDRALGAVALAAFASGLPTQVIYGQDNNNLTAREAICLEIKATSALEKGFSGTKPKTKIVYIEGALGVEYVKVSARDHYKPNYVGYIKFDSKGRVSTGVSYQSDGLNYRPNSYSTNVTKRPIHSFAPSSLANSAYGLEAARRDDDLYEAAVNAVDACLDK